MPSAFVPIAAMDDTAAMFLIGYVVGVCISLYTIINEPKPDGLPADIAQTRIVIIVLGFLPCCWIGPVVQIGALGAYKYRVGRWASSAPARPRSARAGAGPRIPPPPPPGAATPSPAARSTSPPPAPPRAPKPVAPAPSPPSACTGCGKPLRPNARFCASCGARRDAPPASDG